MIKDNFDRYNSYWIGAAILGGASLISNFLGNKEASNNVDAQLKAQAEENQKTRDYNFMLAQKQNQWNLEQWERENAYNSPINQLQRLKDAGLNPDLLQAQNVQSLSASSPNMTSGAPAVPQDFTALGQKPTLSQAFNEAIKSGYIGADTLAKVEDTQRIIADTERLNEMSKNIAKDTYLKDELASLTHEQFQDLCYKNQVTEKIFNELINEARAKCSIAEDQAKLLVETFSERVTKEKNTCAIIGEQAYALECQNGYWTAYKTHAEEIANAEFEIIDLTRKTSAKDFDNYWKIKFIPGVSQAGIEVVKALLTRGR